MSTPDKSKKKKLEAEEHDESYMCKVPKCPFSAKSNQGLRKHLTQTHHMKRGEVNAMVPKEGEKKKDDKGKGEDSDGDSSNSEEVAGGGKVEGEDEEGEEEAVQAEKKKKGQTKKKREVKEKSPEKMAEMEEVKSPKKKAKMKNVPKASVSKKKDKVTRNVDEDSEDEDNFPIGLVCYGEMTANNDYLDTIHQVQVVGFVKGNDDKRKCRLLAFEFSDELTEAVFEIAELHATPGRDLTEQDRLAKGTKVHFLWKCRAAGRKKDVDGMLAGIGVWVKGTVASIGKQSIKVSCVDWGKEEGELQEATVGQENVKLPWR
jgi:hypothetical protein